MFVSFSQVLLDLSPGPRIWICAPLGVVWCHPLQLGGEIQENAAKSWGFQLGEVCMIYNSNTRRGFQRKTDGQYGMGEFVYSNEDSPENSANPWKTVVGRQAYPFEMAPFFVFGSVYIGMLALHSNGHY